MLIFTALISGWTSIVIVSNSTFNIEIKELLTKMYFNQRNFILNVNHLSILLVKDANERFLNTSTNTILLNNPNQFD